MFHKRAGTTELDPVEVCSLLQRGDIDLVDVREPDEHHRERIEGSMCVPLTQLNPTALGADPARVVFHSLTGMRSAKAVECCRKLGKGMVRHMRGGLAAWKAAGLPTRSE